MGNYRDGSEHKRDLKAVRYLENADLNPSLKDSDKMLHFKTMFFKLGLPGKSIWTQNQAIGEINNTRNSGNCFFYAVFRELLMKIIPTGIP